MGRGCAGCCSGPLLETLLHPIIHQHVEADECSKAANELEEFDSTTLLLLLSFMRYDLVCRVRRASNYTPFRVEGSSILPSVRLSAARSPPQ